MNGLFKYRLIIVFSIKMTLITNFKRINTTFLKRNIIRLASNEAASKQKEEKTTRKKSPSQKSDLFENMQQHKHYVFIMFLINLWNR